MRLNAKVALLLIGLLVGGVAGELTVRFGAGLFGLTLQENERILIFAAAGGFIGLLAGFAADRR